jgi:hypothetical protein
MNSFTFNADMVVETLAALAALICLLLGLRFATRRQFFAAALLLIPAGLAIAVFVFFLTFHIRLL